EEAVTPGFRERAFQVVALEKAAYQAAGIRGAESDSGRTSEAVGAQKPSAYHPRCLTPAERLLQPGPRYAWPPQPQGAMEECTSDGSGRHPGNAFAVCAVGDH